MDSGRVTRTYILYPVSPLIYGPESESRAGKKKKERPAAHIVHNIHFPSHGPKRIKKGGKTFSCPNNVYRCRPDGEGSWCASPSSNWRVHSLAPIDGRSPGWLAGPCVCLVKLLLYRVTWTVYIDGWMDRLARDILDSSSLCM